MIFLFPRWDMLIPWSVGEITTHWSLTIYSYCKVDGTVPTHWFIIGPFPNLPFGICGIYFDLKVQWHIQVCDPHLCEPEQFLVSMPDFHLPFTRSDIWTLGEKSLKNKHPAKTNLPCKNLKRHQKNQRKLFSKKNRPNQPLSIFSCAKSNKLLYE